MVYLLVGLYIPSYNNYLVIPSHTFTPLTTIPHSFTILFIFVAPCTEWFVGWGMQGKEEKSGNIDEYVWVYAWLILLYMWYYEQCIDDDVILKSRQFCTLSTQNDQPGKTVSACHAAEFAEWWILYNQAIEWYWYETVFFIHAGKGVPRIVEFLPMMSHVQV